MSPQLKQNNKWGPEVNVIAKWMTTTKHACLACALSVVLISTALPGEEVEARSVTYQLNIPAESLDAALQTLALALHHKLLYRADLVAGKTSRALTGTFTAEEAVRQLLAGTDLAFDITPASVVLIKHKDERKSGDAAVQIQPTAASAAMSSSEASEGMPSDTDKRSGDRLRLAQVDQGSVGPQAVNKQNAGKKEEGLQEIVVTARYEFLSADTRGATNLPLPIEKVPQSISLVSEDFIKAADLKTLGEIAEYTPGAINVGNQENLASIIKLRGFAAGRAVDGINVLGYSNYEPDYAIFERLEVVKGPSSVVYGVASPGGVVNFVTKSPTAQTTDYLLVQGGSWNSYRVEGQAAGALDAADRIRAIGIAVYDQGDSFMDSINHRKASVYGGVNLDLSDSVTAYLHGGYERFRRTPFDGIPTEADGSSAPVPRSFFIGLANDELTTSAYHAEGDLTWHATDMFDFSLRGNYEYTSTTGELGYSCCLDTSGNIGITAENVLEGKVNNYGIGASSIYRLDAIGLKGSFVSLGALYQYNHIAQNDPYGSGKANIFDGEEAVNQAFEAVLRGPLTYGIVNIGEDTLTMSAQSLFQIIDPLSLLVGASYSKPKENSTANYTAGGLRQDFSFSSRVSYRTGLTYEFLPRSNVYVSYSQSFNPQPYLEYGGGGAPVPPLTGNQYEVGLKYRTADRRLLLTAALFQITEKNFAEYYQTIGGFDFYRPLGEVRHRGLELQALGQITHEWQVNAGYAYLDPKIVEDSTPEIVGQTELYLPKQTFSIYTTYTVSTGPLHGLSVGGGERYIASQATSYDNATANNAAFLSATRDLPGYSLVDVTVSYTIGKWLAQFNARNVFDRHYLINNYQTLYYGNVVGDPTNVALSIRRDF